MLTRQTHLPAASLLAGVLGQLLSACSSPHAGGPGAAARIAAEPPRPGPVVVFEAGAGEGRDTWSRVAPAIAKDAPVFAYTRDSLHGTDTTTDGADGAAVVHRLRARLAELGHRPPFLLVGHSIGGLYMQLFARLYPSEVAGVVLIDTTTVDHRARMRAEQPAAYRTVQAFTTLNTLTPLGAELRAMDRTSAQWHAAGAFPTCPCLVLTATEPDALSGRGFMQFTATLQAELATQWPGAEQRIVEAGHYIHREAPDTVIAAVREVLARARASGSAETLRTEVQTSAPGSGSMSRSPP